MVPRPCSSRRRTGAAWISGTPIFLALLLIGPAEAGAPASITKVPPYGGSTASASGYALPSPATPCARASSGTSAPWHARLGAIELNVSIRGESSPGCPAKRYCGANLTCASTYVSLFLPVRTPARSGPHQLIVTYTIHATVRWSRAFGSCSNCSSLFEDELSLNACPQFYDLTTSSAVPTSSSCSLPTFGYAFLGRFAHSGVRVHVLSAGGNGYLNGSVLNATHHYAVWFPDIQVWTNLDLYGMPGSGRATAANDFDPASPGNGFFIDLVTVR